MGCTKRNGRWTPAELNALESAYQAGKAVEVIAGELNRSAAGVWSQIYRLGLACEAKRSRICRNKMSLELDCMPNPLGFLHKN